MSRCSGRSPDRQSKMNAVARIGFGARSIPSAPAEPDGAARECRAHTWRRDGGAPCSSALNRQDEGTRHDAARPISPARVGPAISSDAAARFRVRVSIPRQNCKRLEQRRSNKGPRTAGALSFQTASFAALTGLARTILRAGLAVNIIAWPVNGLVPLRALVAGFLTTTNLAKPGTRNTPFFFSSLWPTSVIVSITLFTSRLESSVAVAIFSISCDFDI